MLCSLVKITLRFYINCKGPHHIKERIIWGYSVGCMVLIQGLPGQSSVFTITTLWGKNSCGSDWCKYDMLPVNENTFIRCEIVMHFTPEVEPSTE